MSDFSPIMARFAFGKKEISQLRIELATTQLPLDTLPLSFATL